MPSPAPLLEGINSVVVPLFDSITVRLGWFSAEAPEFVVLVEYSCKAFLRDFCRSKTSSLVISCSNSLTFESLRMVRGMADLFLAKYICFRSSYHIWGNAA